MSHELLPAFPDPTEVQKQQTSPPGWSKDAWAAHVSSVSALFSERATILAAGKTISLEEMMEHSPHGVSGSNDRSLPAQSSRFLVMRTMEDLEQEFPVSRQAEAFDGAPIRYSLTSRQPSFSSSHKIDARQATLNNFLARNQAFPCHLGREEALHNRILYTNLSAEEELSALRARFLQDADAFVKRGTGAWTILYPREPGNYEELQKVHRTIHAETILALEIAGAANERYLIDEEKTYERILKELSEHPNSFPSPGGRALILFCMSPIYRDLHEDSMGSRCKNILYRLLHRGKYKPPHGRFAPVTCLTATWSDEVAAARHMAAGRRIGPILKKRPQIYSGADVLAEPYREKNLWDYLVNRWGKRGSGYSG